MEVHKRDSNLFVPTPDNTIGYAIFTVRFIRKQNSILVLKVKCRHEQKKNCNTYLYGYILTR